MRSEYVQVAKLVQTKKTVATHVGWGFTMERRGPCGGLWSTRTFCMGGHCSDRTTSFFPSVSWLTRKGRGGGDRPVALTTRCRYLWS